MHIRHYSNDDDEKIIHFEENNDVEIKKECQPLLSQLTEFELPSIEDIFEKGEELGRGGYGTAVKLGDRVYKFYKSGYDPGYDLIERAARYWNEFYENAYEEEYAYCATARQVRITSEEGVNKRKYLTSADGLSYAVLDTPYMEPNKSLGGCFSSCLDRRQYKILKEELERLSYQVMDIENPGNVILYGKERRPVVIDFDHICPTPVAYKWICCDLKCLPIFSLFKKSQAVEVSTSKLSPASKGLIKYYYGKSTIDRAKDYDRHCEETRNLALK